MVGRRPTELWYWEEGETGSARDVKEIAVGYLGMMLQRWVTEGREVHREEHGSEPKSQRLATVIKSLNNLSER